ncbi:MAG: hypothetical protein P1U85_07720 [Verrucomicrobiales bacterium]|nr:hypothetical protein [Verrucomicrobiales bacterium]
MKKSGFILCILATTVVTEVHWAVMQSVTWVAMIQTSNSSATLGEKLLSTISGEAPCDHCEALAEEKGASRSEVLSMIGQAPLLAPTPWQKASTSRTDIYLFLLREGSSSTPLPGASPPLPPPEETVS